MSQEISAANLYIEIVLIVLQAFQVLISVAARLGSAWTAERRQGGPQPGHPVSPCRCDPVQSVPFTIGLVFSLAYFGRMYPHWLYMWLWISYSLIFVGQIRAWWIPYLFRAEPERAARYQIMFGNTHHFLPTRNGLVPNTAHIMLHLATAATLITLFAL